VTRGGCVFCVRDFGGLGGRNEGEFHPGTFVIFGSVCWYAKSGVRVSFISVSSLRQPIITKNKVPSIRPIVGLSRFSNSRF